MLIMTLLTKNIYLLFVDLDVYPVATYIFTSERDEILRSSGFIARKTRSYQLTTLYICKQRLVNLVSV